MVKVTLEIPEELLGDIYIAVGKVLWDGYQDESETDPATDRESVADADETAE